MSDDARDIYLVEDYLQRRRDAISNFRSSYHQNQIEIFKHLFTLGVAGFGYNLLEVSGFDESLIYWLWFVTSGFLSLTIICCFFIFQINGSLQLLMIEDREGELERSAQEEDELSESIELRIVRLNRLKILAFIFFIFGILTILARQTFSI